MRPSVHENRTPSTHPGIVDPLSHREDRANAVRTRESRTGYRQELPPQVPRRQPSRLGTPYQTPSYQVPHVNVPHAPVEPMTHPQANYHTQPQYPPVYGYPPPLGPYNVPYNNVPYGTTYQAAYPPTVAMGMGLPPGGPPDPVDPTDPDPDRDFRPPRRMPRDVSSEHTNRSNPYRLKASDLGYWVPPEQRVEDSKHTPAQMPVELFIKRIQKLSKRHGDQAVLDIIDAALVHVTTWVESLSDEQEAMTETLEGWLQILRDDWGKPITVSRQEARDFTWKNASGHVEFWTKKISKLRAARFKEDDDLYLEVWGSLPS